MLLIWIFLFLLACGRMCQNGGTLDGVTCTCSCVDGYSGDNCESEYTACVQPLCVSKTYLHAYDLLSDIQYLDSLNFKRTLCILQCKNVVSLKKILISWRKQALPLVDQSSYQTTSGLACLQIFNKSTSPLSTDAYSSFHFTLTTKNQQAFCKYLALRWSS